MAPPSFARGWIHPQACLTDVLQRLPSMNITQIAELLPVRWNAPGSAAH